MCEVYLLTFRSPHMGLETKPTLSALMTLLNSRRPRWRLDSASRASAIHRDWLGC